MGDKVIFTSLTLSDDGFLTYLTGKNLLLNTEISVLKIENFDKSMTIEINNSKEILSRQATEKILVKK